MAAELDITEEEMNALTQSIWVRYGVDFTSYEPKSLRRRILRILNRFELASIHDLWVMFLNDSQFVQVFMNEVSVGMTSMFRDPQLWQKLKPRVLSEFGNHTSISIWHAGCSTGEEVYSMAILLKEINLLHKTKSMASDFNRNALEEGRKGIYHKIKMIENETNYRAFNPYKDFSIYYTTDGTQAIMDPSLVKNAQFEYLNLITDPFPANCHIIFCRNVMIYVDAFAKTKLLNKFHQALEPGGLFIIGYFDTMSHLMDHRMFELVDEETKVYRKLPR
ncbi:MAG: hypothetical protein K2Q22_07780 [Cytophagales bacterium]|nr:hypothetical protein [Cytophagales bacterium]